MTLFHAQLAPEDAEQLRLAQEAAAFENGGGLSYEHESTVGAEAIAAAGAGAEAGAVLTAVPRPQQRVVSEREKLGRNDPCWCGSGKKFKKCHGA
jgi:preprotein translocase subunit SecA